MKLNLTNPQKSKLIEILLIVGALLSALQLPLNLIWLFMLFVICAIVYYIILQKEPKPSVGITIIVTFISLGFSGIMAYELGYSLGLTLGNQYILLTIIVTIVYYFLIGWILFEALKVGNPFTNIGFKTPKKEKTITKSVWENDPAFVKRRK